MADELSLGEAAAALGVSVDTLRRWDRKGQIRTFRDQRNRRVVPASEVQRLSSRPVRHRTGTERSARNRFAGVVRSVECDGVMALVELVVVVAVLGLRGLAYRGPAGGAKG